MKNIKLTFTFLFILSFDHIFSCEFNLPKTILLTKKTDEKDFLKFETNCDPQVQKKISSLLLNFQGEVDLRYLTENHFKEDDLSFNIKSVSLFDIASFIQKNLYKNDPSRKVQNIKTNFHSNEKYLYLFKDDKFTVTKEDFQIKLNIQGPNSQQTYWFTADFMQKKKALLPTKDIKAHFPGNLSHYLKESWIYAPEDSELFTFKELANFYTPLKVLKKGLPVQIQDVHPRLLIDKGDQILLNIKGKAFTISTLVEASESGKIYDIIKVKDKKRKKTFSAKVTGIGKVEIKL